jgi:hypothetical protein
MTYNQEAPPTTNDSDDENQPKLKTLRHRAREARQSISEELGLAAGATVDQMRFILEDIMVHRIDKLVRTLQTQRNNFEQSQKELSTHNKGIEKNLLRITDDNQRLNAQIQNFARDNAVRNAINSKLNGIQNQNARILTKIGDKGNKKKARAAEDLVAENNVLRGKLEQSENYIRFLEQSKMQTVIAMSSEIEKLRQQIIEHNNVCPNNRNNNNNNNNNDNSERTN